MWNVVPTSIPFKTPMAVSSFWFEARLSLWSPLSDATSPRPSIETDTLTSLPSSRGSRRYGASFSAIGAASGAVVASFQSGHADWVGAVTAAVGGTVTGVVTGAGGGGGGTSAARRAGRSATVANPMAPTRTRSDSKPRRKPSTVTPISQTAIVGASSRAFAHAASPCSYVVIVKQDAAVLSAEVRSLEGGGGRRDLFVVAASALIARCLYWVLVTPAWTPDSDADQYVRLARSVVGGDGYSLVFPQLVEHATAFRPPLYPLTLVPAAALTAGLWPARLTNVLLGTAVVVLVFVIARRIVGRAAGLAAGLVAAVYPPLLANDTVTLSEPLAILLLLTTVLLVDDRRWLWVGVTGGALMLTRPNAYLVIITVAVVAFLHAGWRAATTLLLTAALITLPWVIRNAVQVGTPELVTSDGFTLAAIFAAPAQQQNTFVDPVLDPAYADDQDLKFAQFDEAAWNNELLHRAWNGIRGNPRYLVTNGKRNTIALFELSDNDVPEAKDGRNLDFRRATLPLFYVVTLAGIGGLWLHRRDSTVRLLAVLAAEFALLMILILAPPRLSRSP